jgi:hypothetical protein
MSKPTLHTAQAPCQSSFVPECNDSEESGTLQTTIEDFDVFVDWCMNGNDVEIVGVNIKGCGHVIPGYMFSDATLLSFIQEINEKRAADAKRAADEADAARWDDAA